MVCDIHGGVLYFPQSTSSATHAGVLDFRNNTYEHTLVYVLLFFQGIRIHVLYFLDTIQHNILVSLNAHAYS